jgi:RAT1-interacting protein
MTACQNDINGRNVGLRRTMNDEGVWRIRRRPGLGHIEVFQVVGQGHGDILTDEFINWRIKLSLKTEAAAEGRG